jgi:uncharacterized membrane protein
MADKIVSGVRVEEEPMEPWLIVASSVVALTIDAIALTIVAFGTLEAFLSTLRLVLRRSATNSEKREVWLGLARWLVAGLTFQLAADIVRTSVAPTWDEIGRLAAIAAIRTFLNFFLDRDVEKVGERQHRTVA